MSIEEVSAVFNEFKAELESPYGNLEKCARLLTQLKIQMTQFHFLVPGSAPSVLLLKATLLSREILEHAVLLAVKQRDFEAFARHVAQVKTYYFDTNKIFKDLPASTRQYPILGLNLLYLLALNRIAEFHTELELIPLDKHDNVYIQHPIQLEQYIMEGAYNKVYNAVKDVPSENYAYFIEYLMETRLKDEIAECSEKAYDHLPLNAASKLLQFDSVHPFLEYSTNRGWQVQGDNVYFKKDAQQKAPIPSMSVISQTLLYAKELERIV